MMFLLLIIASQIGFTADISDCNHFRFVYSPALSQSEKILESQYLVSGIESKIFQPRYQKILRIDGHIAIETHSGYSPDADNEEKDRNKLKEKLTLLKKYPEMSVECSSMEKLAQLKAEQEKDWRRFRNEFPTYPRPPDSELVNPTPEEILLSCNEYSLLVDIGNWERNLKKRDLISALSILERSPVLSQFLNSFVKVEATGLMIAVNMSSPRYLHEPHTKKLLHLYRRYTRVPDTFFTCNKRLAPQI